MESQTPFINKLIEMPYAVLEPRVLINAIRLGVFEELITPQTSVELADKKNWHKENTEIFLQALYALKYIQKESEGYLNSDETNKYLVRSSEDYSGDLLLFYGTDLGGVFPADFSELVTQGPPAMEAAAMGEMNTDFTAMGDMMRAYQSGFPQRQTRNILHELEEFQSAKKILDLGCGAGMIGLGLAKDNADAQITLFDVPMMEPIIAKSIELSNLSDRAVALTGDFTISDIGSGYDIILSSSSIYAAKHCIDDFMRKLYDALNPGGVFVCISDGVENDHSGPWDMILAWMVYRMKGMDMEVQKDFVSQAGIKAGFKAVSKKTLLLAGGRMDVDILKKDA